ncbi:NAD(P)-dependent alcohol dehydrogenase [Paenibacillus sp. P25]|nr:NAD(P)-dependent alcohol dehydrogenase [Paenibacillus sp. P25]
MKAFEIRQFGLDYFAAVERPVPAPGPGEVLIRMRAFALNYKDIGIVEGKLYPNLKWPLIPVSDGVGEVEALGEGTTRFRIGERVSGIISQGWISGEPTEAWMHTTLGGPLNGVLAEYVVLPEQGLVRVPEHLTDEEAAALPCAGVTAWHAVMEEGRVRAGDTVVVQGTGGVSLFALQFAKLSGAAVIVTSSGDEKLERAKQLGADYGINYRRTPDWSEAVLEWTGGRGADLVVELGGASTLNQSAAAARIGGQISLIGILSGDTVDGFNIRAAFRKKLRIQGINVGDRDMFEAMNRAIGQNKLRPVIDRVFPFEQSAEALRYLGQGGHFGKVCIKL